MRLLFLLSLLLAVAGSVFAAQRPAVAGPNGGVSAGHPLTTAAALEILQHGGNAFDAGVAALLVGGVIEQDHYGLGGEALVLVYPKEEGRITSIVGQGWAPKGATIDWYTKRNKTLAGKGLDPAVVPGAIHAALTVLEKWGTMSLEEVSVRAIEYAQNGFPLRESTTQDIEKELAFIQEWPHNRRYWLKPDGSLYEAGETIAFSGLARTLTRLVEAERAAKSNGRQAGIVAARDRFYKGDLAQEMVSFLKQHGTPFVLEDFSEFFARIEEPTSTTYRDYTIYKQSFNGQGPALLIMLNILETFDLASMGHHSADYLHVLVETIKLAYADRDTYFADPDFVKIPGSGLLSKEYARTRADQIDMLRASEVLRAGDPFPFDPDLNEWPFRVAGGERDASALDASAVEVASLKDTTHIAIIDRQGNIFDATPSGGWIGGSVILGNTGIGMSVRGSQFWLDPDHVSQLRPRSRPRYTLTPSIVSKDGKPFLAIGTPGGDNQEQTIVQTLLSIVEFWDAWYPNLHEAIEWPRVQTLHLYGSVWPHPVGLNRLNVEEDIGSVVIRTLRARGHEVRVVPPRSISGCATVVMIDPATGTRLAGADPRRECYAAAY